MREERLDWMRDDADDSLDAVLDRALHGYAEVVPREGFEARILARVDAEVREGRSGNWRWLIPAVSGLALVSVALALVIVLQPGKKEVGEVEQPTAPQNLDVPEQGASIEHSSGIARERVKVKSAAISEKATNNFESEQETLIHQLMANGPEAIASLARIDKEENSAHEQGERSAPMKIAPIHFERIQIEAIDGTDNTLDTKDKPLGTETSSSDAASE